jgi:hypothetical protein
VESSTREVVGKKEPNVGVVFVFNTIVIVGPGVLAEVRIPEAMRLPEEGESIVIKVEVSSYRDQPELLATEIVSDRPAK